MARARIKIPVNMIIGEPVITIINTNYIDNVLYDELFYTDDQEGFSYTLELFRVKPNVTVTPANTSFAWMSNILTYVGNTANGEYNNGIMPSFDPSNYSNPEYSSWAGYVYKRTVAVVNMGGGVYETFYCTGKSSGSRRAISDKTIRIDLSKPIRETDLSTIEVTRRINKIRIGNESGSPTEVPYNGANPSMSTTTTYSSSTEATISYTLTANKDLSVDTGARGQIEWTEYWMKVINYLSSVDWVEDSNAPVANYGMFMLESGYQWWISDKPASDYTTPRGVTRITMISSINYTVTGRFKQENTRSITTGEGTNPYTLKTNEWMNTGTLVTGSDLISDHLAQSLLANWDNGRQIVELTCLYGEYTEYQDVDPFDLTAQSDTPAYPLSNDLQEGFAFYDDYGYFNGDPSYDVNTVIDHGNMMPSHSVSADDDMLIILRFKNYGTYAPALTGLHDLGVYLFGDGWSGVLYAYSTYEIQESPTTKVIAFMVHIGDDGIPCPWIQGADLPDTPAEGCTIDMQMWNTGSSSAYTAQAAYELAINPPPASTTKYTGTDGQFIKVGDIVSPFKLVNGVETPISKDINGLEKRYKVTSSEFALDDRPLIHLKMVEVNGDE